MAFNAHLLDGMVIFNELVKHGSFTRTAEFTGHSTSYISKEIARLEARLGVRLLHRTTRSLTVTAEGEHYLQQCQQIIADAEDAEAALTGGQSEPSGTLRVSSPASFDIPSMQAIFAGFIQAYPQVKLELELSNRKVDMVAEGFDVVVRATRQLEDSSLISRQVYSSHIVTVASPGYLQEFGEPTTPDELSDRPAITYSLLQQSNQWQFEGEADNTVSVKLNSRAETNSSQMQLALCTAGQGITRLPHFLCAEELAAGKLQEILGDWPKPYVGIYLLYPSRKHMSAKLRAFIDFVAEEMKAL